MRNHSFENDFHLHEKETACRTHFHTKGFALRLVSKQRHMRTRKWPINFGDQFQTELSISLTFRKCKKKRLLCFEFFWYKVFDHLKLKLLDSLLNFVLKCASFSTLFYTLYSELPGEDLKNVFPDPSFLATKALYQVVTCESWITLFTG